MAKKGMDYPDEKGMDYPDDIQIRDLLGRRSDKTDDPSDVSIVKAIKAKLDHFQIRIPESLVQEVDKLVAESGLYMDRGDFVVDAVRRLVMENKKEETEETYQGADIQSRGGLSIGKQEEKGASNRFPNR